MHAGGGRRRRRRCVACASEADPSLSSASPLEQKSGHSSSCVISFHHCSRHKRKARVNGGEEKHLQVAQISRSIKANAAGWARLSIREQPTRNKPSPYPPSSPTDLPPHPPSSSQPLTERERRMNGPLYYSVPCAVKQQHQAHSAAFTAFINRLGEGRGVLVKTVQPSRT